MARVYNDSISKGEGRGMTWGKDCGSIALPWQEVETGHHTVASLDDLYTRAWGQIREDADYYKANNYGGY